MNYLFLFSNCNFLPSLLLPLLVKNLSFFHKVEVCWNKETGSLFFAFFVTHGLFNLKVYAFAIYLEDILCSDTAFFRYKLELLEMVWRCWWDSLSFGLRGCSSSSSFETSSYPFYITGYDAKWKLSLCWLFVCTLMQY